MIRLDQIDDPEELCKVMSDLDKRIRVLESLQDKPKKKPPKNKETR